MVRPRLSALSSAQRRILKAVLEREGRRQPNFVSDLVAELGLRHESSLAPTLQRMARLGVIEIQGGGVRGRQRLILSTEKGRHLLAPPQPASSSKSAASPPNALPPNVLPLTLASDRLPASSPSQSPFLQSPLQIPLQLPLLGKIPAGPLEEALASEAAEAVVVEELLRAHPGDFLLRVKGDSMIGDGILEGDLVLLRPGVEVHAGEIAAVLSTEGPHWEATLKRIFWRGPDGTSVPPAQATEVLLRASNPAYPDRLFAADSIQIAGVFRGLVRPMRF
jgi:repressor LexA